MKQAHGWLQSPAVLRMSRMLKLFFQMNESAGGLNQPLEIARIVCRCLEPDVFEDIVRLVVVLLVPKPKIGAIKTVFCDSVGGAFALEPLHHS